MYDLGIEYGDVYIDGQFLTAHLYVKDGKIAAVTKDLQDSKKQVGASGKWVLPGFIDPHVHFALDVGKYQSADDFYSGSVSGAFGGITTYIDFLDPIQKASEVEAALSKRLNQAKNSVTDYLFHLTVANPEGQVDQIVRELKRLKLRSVKLFTTYSDSDRRTYDEEIYQLLELSKSYGFTVLAHIENDDMIKLSSDFEIKDLPISRPALSETSEALKLASYAKKTKGRLYMVHCSLGQTVEALLDDYKDILGKHMFIESCPQYFVLTEDVFRRTDGYKYILAPPLRDELSTEKLIQLKAYVNTIGTDHCPFMTHEKHHNKLIGTPMGIGGIEHSFSLMYTRIGLDTIDKMTKNPAKIYGLYPEKGSLNIGTDADIVLYDPHKVRQIGKDHSNCDFNVYDGMTVKGQVESTILAGKFVVENGVLQEDIKGNYLG